MTPMRWHSFAEGDRWRPAPAFRLASAEGRLIALSDYRGRANLVLFFAHSAECPACRAALESFIARQADYRQQEAEVVIVLPTPEEAAALRSKLALPFPLLADPDGATRQAYARLLNSTGEGDAMLFVLDRYGAPFVAAIAGEPDDPMLHGEILDWLAFIEMQCPE